VSILDLLTHALLAFYIILTVSLLMQAPNFFNIILYDVGQSGKRTVVGFFNGIYKE